MLVNGLILVKEPEHNAAVSENLVSENMNMISKLKPKGPRGPLDQVGARHPNLFLGRGSLEKCLGETHLKKQLVFLRGF